MEYRPKNKKELERLILDCYHNKLYLKPQILRICMNYLIISTQKARKLIDILPEDMINPINGAKVEERLKKILERSITPDDFRKDYKDFVIKCFNDLKELSCDSNNMITSKPSKKTRLYSCIVEVQ